MQHTAPKTNVNTTNILPPMQDNNNSLQFPTLDNDMRRTSHQMEDGNRNQPLPLGNVSRHVAEPVYELEQKGNTSVIRVSYPAPPLPESINVTSTSIQQPPPRREGRRSSSLKNFSASVFDQDGRNKDSMASDKGFFGGARHRKSITDSQMGLDNFIFCTVLGRGHFGKVSYHNH